MPHRAEDIAAGRPLLRVGYQAAAPTTGEVLACIGFGDASAGADPRCLRVALAPLDTAPLMEVWTVPGPVQSGTEDRLAWARSSMLQFVAVEVPEHDGDIESAARLAYAQIAAFTAASAMPHVLRMWNYLDAVTAGEGDGERYRRFCVGRALGMGAGWRPYPAATAIGRSAAAATGTLQVYALSARHPGLPLENPRQVSAYRYPRQYGPQPPSFARAMRDGGSELPLLVSGTASVVGHASAHVGDLMAQVDETCTNLELLVDAAAKRDPRLPATPGAHSVLKVYLRQPQHADAVRARLLARFPGAQLLMLEAEVCRDELLVEIDGFHG